MAINENQILFPGIVEDDQDPMCLGRIRVIPQTEIADFPSEVLNYYNRIDNGKVNFEKWGKSDPYVFLPLLPINFFNVPKNKEYVSILYQDKNFRRENQFYIPGPISSPMNIKFEHFAGAITYLGQGSFNALSKSLKDLNNQFNEAKSFGIFPEPGDVAILGRGSTDLVLKENEVLLRAGKTQTKDLSPNTFPTGNQNRAFIQLSNFTQTKVAGTPEEYQVPKANVEYVKKMIEWELYTLNSNENAMTGRVTLRKVYPKSSKVNTANFKLGSITELNVGEDYGDPLVIFNFFGKTKEEVANLVNSIADSLFEGKFNVPGYEIENPGIFTPTESEPNFPFVITPNRDTYVKGLRNQDGVDDTVDSVEFNNFLTIAQKIQVKQKTSSYGFLLISAKSGDGKNPIVGQSFSYKKEVVVNSEYFTSPITYGVMGGQKLYLLSQDSEGPKGKISLRDTLYGIPQPRFVGDLDSIENLSYPMVRGDKMIELLEKIIEYLTTHVHPFFGMPPVPSPVLEDVLKTVADAPNTILNQNIRIN